MMTSPTHTQKPTAQQQREETRNFVEVRKNACEHFINDKVMHALGCVLQLQFTMAKKVDVGSRRSFLHVVESSDEWGKKFNGGKLFNAFFHQVCNVFERNVSEAFNNVGDDNDNSNSNSNCSDVDGDDPALSISGLYPALRAAASAMFIDVEDLISNSEGIDSEEKGGILSTTNVDNNLLSDLLASTIGIGTESKSDSKSKSKSKSTPTTTNNNNNNNNLSTTFVQHAFNRLHIEFIRASTNRLNYLLQLMFPREKITSDAVLPSKYDVKHLHKAINAEISLADPREGGGELSMAEDLAEVVVVIMDEFCGR